MTCSSVDLPEPDGPTTPTSSPSLDLEADSVERPHASGVLLDDVLQREAHRGTTTRVPGARPEPVTCTQSSAKAPRVTPTSRREPASSTA